MALLFDSTALEFPLQLGRFTRDRDRQNSAAWDRVDIYRNFLVRGGLLTLDGATRLEVIDAVRFWQRLLGVFDTLGAAHRIGALYGGRSRNPDAGSEAHADVQRTDEGVLVEISARASRTNIYMPHCTLTRAQRVRVFFTTAFVLDEAYGLNAWAEARVASSFIAVDGALWVPAKAVLACLEARLLHTEGVLDLHATITLPLHG